MAYGKTGRYSLFIDRTLRALRYWYSLQDIDLNIIPKQAYVASLNEITCNTDGRSIGFNWAASIKSCLNRYGFSGVWLAGGVAHVEACITSFRQQMTDWTYSSNF
eukprot:TRINITY_DN58732_c0_g1_i1.p1 TRINITY_DN58732_c0_g1~~TRINITY_DN58732_c0_g1_i1.p1  ORF type:complete len:105 (+),score=2.83 TRINITY_DN58732_c0_g1_i1:202-516(+)